MATKKINENQRRYISNLVREHSTQWLVSEKYGGEWPVLAQFICDNVTDLSLSTTPSTDGYKEWAHFAHGPLKKFDNNQTSQLIRALKKLQN